MSDVSHTRTIYEAVFHKNNMKNLLSRMYEDTGTAFI